MTTIRKRLEQLSHDMAELGTDMERAECWCDELSAHGQELQNAAVLARTWADGIREQLCDAVDEDAPKLNEPKRCLFYDCGWCYHVGGQHQGCVGRDDCGAYEPRN